MSFLESQKDKEECEKDDYRLSIVFKLIELQKEAIQCGLRPTLKNWFEIDDERCLSAYILNSNVEIDPSEYFEYFIQTPRHSTSAAVVLQCVEPEFVLELAEMALENLSRWSSNVFHFFTNCLTGPLFFELLERACGEHHAWIADDFITRFAQRTKCAVDDLAGVVTDRQLSEYTTDKFFDRLKQSTRLSDAFLAIYYRFGLVDFTKEDYGIVFDSPSLSLRALAVFQVPLIGNGARFSQNRRQDYENLLRCYYDRSVDIPDRLRDVYQDLCRSKRLLIAKRLLTICSCFYWLPALLQLAIVDHDEPALSALVRTSTKYEMITKIKSTAKHQFV